MIHHLSSPKLACFWIWMFFVASARGGRDEDDEDHWFCRCAIAIQKELLMGCLFASYVRVGFWLDCAGGSTNPQEQGVERVGGWVG